MNNLKLQILKGAYAQPGCTVGGLADTISRGRRTEKEICHLMEKGYLVDSRGLELSKKGLAYIDSASFQKSNETDRKRDFGPIHVRCCCSYRQLDLGID